MALRMRSRPPAYEVRCPRCDVSFPAETRTCFHCGGPTGQASFFEGDGPEATLVSSHATSSDYGTSGPTTADAYGSVQSNTPIEPAAESPFSLGGVFEDDRTGDRELETDAPARSMLGSLVQSLGGIIWVLLLIGFSLARSCSD